MPATMPSDEFAAAQILFDLRFPDGWRCPHCGHPRFTHLRTRPRLFECNRCGRATSVTAGTALHRCRVPLVKVITAAFVLSDELSMSARRLARLLEVSVETAWTLGHRLRSAFLPQELRLSGEPVLSSCAFHLRPPPRSRKRFVAQGARFQILWDRSLHMVVQIGDRDPHAVRRFVDRHSSFDRPMVFPLWIGLEPAAIGNGVHRGVSDRWLVFYASAIAGWHNTRVTDGNPTRATLGGALACATHPYARLRPHRPPTWPGAWQQGDRPLQVLREWGRFGHRFDRD